MNKKQGVRKVEERRAKGRKMLIKKENCSVLSNVWERHVREHVSIGEQ
jgi:hypothetical protein